jgi:hypothetical protein
MNLMADAIATGAQFDVFYGPFRVHVVGFAFVLGGEMIYVSLLHQIPHLSVRKFGTLFRPKLLGYPALVKKRLQCPNHFLGPGEEEGNGPREAVEDVDHQEKESVSVVVFCISRYDRRVRLPLIIDVRSDYSLSPEFYLYLLVYGKGFLFLQPLPNLGAVHDVFPIFTHGLIQLLH